jgi:hypothetical protein
MTGTSSAFGSTFDEDDEAMTYWQPSSVTCIRNALSEFTTGFQAERTIE